MFLDNLKEQAMPTNSFDFSEYKFYKTSVSGLNERKNKRIVETTNKLIFPSIKIAHIWAQTQNKTIQYNDIYQCVQKNSGLGDLGKVNATRLSGLNFVEVPMSAFIADVNAK